MITSISSSLRKLATELQCSVAFTPADIDILNNRAVALLRMVRENVDKDVDPFKGLSDEDKRILLAFVVYKRQNITTSNVDRPNVEDAAKILHGGVYQTDGDKNKDKKTLKELTEDLKKQLNKAGLKIN